MSSGMADPAEAGETPPGIAAWLRGRAALRVAAALGLIVAGQIAFAAYEILWLDLPPVREGPPAFDALHLAQSAFLLVASALLVAALFAARAPGCALDRTALSPRARAAAWVVFAVATAATILFLADPAAFHAGAQEDRPLEWVSALLLFAASGLFALECGRRLIARRGPAAAILAAGLLAALFFVVGMEEVSWMQRVFGFGTPEALAKANWQGEFNLHNVQTDLSETVYYAGAALFLILLPLLRDLVAARLAAHPLFAFVPHRPAAAIAAPAAIFTYGHWNLYAVQLGSMLTLLVMLGFARAAAARGDAGERISFLSLAAAVAAGQALFLAYGVAMPDLPDATEYKELFIAAGFAAYALAFRARSPAGGGVFGL